MAIKIVEVRNLKKGNYVVIEGEPCKIIDYSSSKPGKHGAAKVRIIATSIFDGKKMQLLTSGDNKVDVPLITRQAHQVLSVSGGTAQLTNLSAYLSEKMGVPVAPLPLITSGGLSLDPQNRLLMPHAYGLSMRTVADGRFSQVNLLKDEFAYRTEIRGKKGKMVYVGVFLGLVLALFAFDGVNRYTAKNRRYLELKREIRRVFEETFPEVKQIVEERQQMKGKILELQRESQALASLGGLPVTGLGLIREVSERIPPGVEVDVDTFSFDAEKVRLSGRTDSFESVDRILKALQEVDLFENVSLSTAKVDAKDNKVDFKLSISLESS